MAPGDLGGKADAVAQGSDSRQELEVRAAIAQAAEPVRRFLFGMCGSWHEAQDLAQEALLKAWQKREKFQGRSSLQTWIFAIARNCWLDCLRRKKTAKTMINVENTDIADDAAQGPTAVAANVELAHAVATAMAQLPPEQREPLAMRESQGLTFAQIAQTLDLPVATVKSRVRYALLKLADTLEPYRDNLT